MDSTSRDQTRFKMYRLLRKPVAKSQLIARAVLESPYLASLTNDPNISHKPGSTLTHVAAGNHERLFDVILNNEGLSTLKDENSWTPVHTGVKSFQSAGFKILGLEPVKFHLALQSDFRGTTPMALAARYPLVAFAIAVNEPLNFMLYVRDGNGVAVFEDIYQTRAPGVKPVETNHAPEIAKLLFPLVRDEMVLSYAAKFLPARIKLPR